MDVELRHLEAFLSAARHRNFTRAAKALSVSQPSFTVQIRQLEAQLGVRLFDRNTRSVQLTRVGKDLHPVLERLVAELTAVLCSTKESSAKRSGRVLLAALPSLAATVLPPVLSTLKADHPNVTIHLREAPARRVAGMVKSEEVDFGIGWLKERDREIRFTPLFADRMSAIFRAGSPLEKRKSVTLRDLESFPLILMDAESSVRTVVEDAFAAIGSPIIPAWEATYISTALALARAGLGVTILPACVLRMDAGEDLRARPIREPNLDRSIGIIQKNGRTLSPPAALVFQACLSAMQAQTLNASWRATRASRETRSGPDEPPGPLR